MIWGAECGCVFLWYQICRLPCFSSPLFPQQALCGSDLGISDWSSGGPDVPTIWPYVLYMSKLSLREWSRVTQGAGGRAGIANPGSLLQVTTPHPPAFGSLWLSSPRVRKLNTESPSYLPKIPLLNPLKAFNISMATLFCWFSIFQNMLIWCSIQKKRGLWPKRAEKPCKNMFPF